MASNTLLAAIEGKRGIDPVLDLCLLTLSEAILWGEPCVGDTDSSIPLRQATGHSAWMTARR